MELVPIKTCPKIKVGTLLKSREKVDRLDACSIGSMVDRLDGDSSVSTGVLIFRASLYRDQFQFFGPYWYLNF